MARALSVGILAALAVLPFALTASGDSTLIPGTAIQLIDLEGLSADLTLGGHASFSWILWNTGNATETIQVAAASTNADFRHALSLGSAILPPEAFREVFLNVTAPAGGVSHEAYVTVTFLGNASAPALSRAVHVTASARATAPSVIPALLAAGAIIVIGFAASLLFERTKVPELLFLIGLGLFLGPLATGLLGIVVVSPDILSAITPYVAAIALMIILFDGGLNLSLASLRGRFALSLFHTVFIFVLSVVFAAFLLLVLLGYPLPVGFMLAAAVGGTSGAVVLGLVRRMTVPEDVRTILSVESAITDVLCVVLVFAAIAFITGGPGATLLTPAVSLAQAFLVAVLVGGVGGLALVFLIGRLEGKDYGFMLAIGFLLILYAVTEQFGGSGSLAAFLYGLLLGNRNLVAAALKRDTAIVHEERFKQFHGEITFLVRTFFFVFLGLVFTLRFGGTWTVRTDVPLLSAMNNSFPLLLLGILIIFLALLTVRAVVSAATNILRKGAPREGKVLTTMMGRGLAAAVLASLPFAVPAFTTPSHPAYSDYHALMAPYQEQFLNIAFFLILLTVITTTLGVVRAERDGSPPRRTSSPMPRLPAPLKEDDEWRTELLAPRPPPP